MANQLLQMGRRKAGAKRFTRRQVLRGAGGFTLALPWLPSLMPAGADAAPAGFASPRFVAICSQHGGVWNENMWPADSMLTESMNYAGHQIRRGTLTADVAGGMAALSPVLRANSTDLSDRLIGQMNVIRGLDYPWYIAHHSGGHLGNAAATAGNGGEVLARPTIDQVMAWSSSFYDDLSGVLERSMVMGGRSSYGFSNPQAQSGGIQETPQEYSSLSLFNRIFQPDDDPVETNPRPPVVDRVMENYQSLRDGSRRLSATDRVRLEEHVQRIDELQRRLTVAVSCGDIPTPDRDFAQEWPEYPYGGLSPDAQGQNLQLFNDVVAAAFLCGTSRVAVFTIDNTFDTVTIDRWHDDIAHQAHLPDGAAQQVMTDSHQRLFENIMVDLMRKLDVDEGDGSTVLDNSLIAWSQESGSETHESVSMPVITAGGAAGCMRTGQYLDYRNTNQVFVDEYGGVHDGNYVGINYNQWLGTALAAMGIPRSEFEDNPQGGYGGVYVSPGRAPLYPSSVMDAMGENLPWTDPNA